MDTSTIIQIATLVSVAIGVFGLLVSVRAYKRQVSAYFLLAYTQRFDEAIQSLPLRVWAAHLFHDEEIPDPSDELTLGIFRCLNFLSQMHFFCNTGYIPKNVWRKNESAFAQLLRSPMFVREWKRLAPLFATNPAFSQYVEEVQQADH
jgi:hypothetical protein